VHRLVQRPVLDAGPAVGVQQAAQAGFGVGRLGIGSHGGNCHAASAGKLPLLIGASWPIGDRRSLFVGFHREWRPGVHPSGLPSTGRGIDNAGAATCEHPLRCLHSNFGSHDMHSRRQRPLLAINIRSQHVGDVSHERPATVGSHLGNDGGHRSCSETTKDGVR